MKNILKLLSISLIIGLVCMTSCTPGSYSMASSAPNISSYKEGTDYTLTQLSSNPNKIVLVNNHTNMIARWSYTATNGISNDFISTTNNDTLTLPYGGVYSFMIQYEGNGGLSDISDTTKFTVSTNKSLIVDPDSLWTKLCGSGTKTWVLDIDAYAKSYGAFKGPLYFYGTADSWADVSGGQTATGDTWNWCPDYPSNTWLMTATDYGTMTFNSNNLTMTAVRKVDGVTTTGTFMMDCTNHTMTVKNTAILMDTGRISQVTSTSRGSVKLFSMTDNSMQLAVLRDNDSADGKCYLVYNYIPLTLYQQLSGH
jgi:hypothetical protein